MAESSNIITRGILPYLTATLIGTAATACDLIPDGAGVVLGSRHVGASEGFEEFNPGIGLSWECGPTETRVAAYRNSYGDFSAALTFTDDRVSLSGYGFSAHPFVGVARYDREHIKAGAEIGDTELFPFAGLEITHESTPIVVQVIPSDGEYVDFVVGFGLRWDLN